MKASLRSSIRSLGGLGHCSFPELWGRVYANLGPPGSGILGSGPPPSGPPPEGAPFVPQIGPPIADQEPAQVAANWPAVTGVRLAPTMLQALFVLSLSLATSGLVHAQEAARPGKTTLKRPKGDSLPVDSRGFIHRWFVLEPVPVAGGLTEPAVKEALKLAALPEAEQPAESTQVTINGVEHVWHALDTLNYNLNLYHFAWSLSKPTSNVLFWVETTVDSPREMQNVRLAIGSNAASRWWLNGELVIALNDDRQSVIDDGVSRRLTLRKGPNVIRAAIINCGGATDFCAENDRPLLGLDTRL